MKFSNLFITVIILLVGTFSYAQQSTVDTLPSNIKSWLLKGNEITDTSSSFLGTLDSMPLLFKVNNMRAGLIEFGPDNKGANTSFGYQTLLKIRKQGTNAAFGYQALKSNESTDNCAVGYRTSYSNIRGSGNTAVGTYALQNNTSSYNTAVGTHAIWDNNQGTNNTAVGFRALIEGEEGSYNVAVGSNALYYNTTYHNTGVGYSALKENTTGLMNTVMGSSAVLRATTGSYNVGIGGQTLYRLETGSYNTAIGSFADVRNPGTSNSTTLGYGTGADNHNQVRIGNGYVTSIGGQVGWTSLSDERTKKGIKENVPGLVFIKALKPVTYYFDLSKENKLLQKSDTALWENKDAIEKMRFTGLIAQEVEKAAGKIKYDFSGIDKSGLLWGLRYSDFIAPLIKSVQELSQQNDTLAKENADLKTRLEKLEAIVLGPNFPNASVPQKLQPHARLEQNIPNPATDNTIINYFIPISATNAFINLYNSSGGLIKSLQLPKSGQGYISVDLKTFIVGTYTYTLVVNGVITDSKHIIVSK